MATIPAGSKIPISFIALGFLALILYSYLLSHTERGLPLLDGFSVSIHLVWLSGLAWVAWGVHRRKPSAKWTLLFLAGLVGLLTGFDLFEEDSSLLLTTVSVVETLFFLAAYLSFPKIEVQR